MIRSRWHAALLCGGFILLGAPAQGADPSLVGYWTIEEGAGLATSDISGNGFDGVFDNVSSWGGPSWVSSPFGNYALSFDGVNDRLNVGNPPELQVTGAMTLAAWVNVRGFSSNGRIVNKSSNNSGQYGWSLNIERGVGTTVPPNSGAFQIASSSSVVLWVTTVGAIPANQWIHLCGVYEPGSSMRIYTNGFLNNERVTGVPSSQFNNALNVSIGARSLVSSGNPQTPFNGVIDEVRVYNRALSATEVAALADQTPRPPFFRVEPVSQVVVEPEPVAFHVAAAGQPPLALQWLSNGVAIAGATHIAFTLPVTSTNISGSHFAVRVTSSLGVVTSSNAVLTVIPPPPKVKDTKFSVDHGFFSTPFELVITSGTAEALIRYTLDGSAPSTNHGALYSGPIDINETTVLRAIAYRQGMQPTDVDTQTYIFLSDVLRQPQTPAGFPPGWVNTSGTTVWPADYEMDPQITSHPEYASQLSNALVALPALSLAMDRQDVFGANGIYANGGSGSNQPWERPASVELIHPDGRTGFRINCGIRPHSHVVRKRSFKLLFKTEYGAGKLRYPLFNGAPLNGETAVDEFDRLILRAGVNDSWQAFYFQGNSGRFATYSRDQMVRDSLLAVAGFGAHGTYVHLYVNGLYWGVYNVVERPDHWFTSAYFGGEPADWYALNTAGSIEGDSTRFNTMTSFAQANNMALLNHWQTITQYLNVTAYADYLLVQNFSGTGDWPGNNWYGGNRNNPSGGALFFTWDAEDSWVKLNADNGQFRSNDGPWINPGLLNDPNAPSYTRNDVIARFWRAMIASPEFRLAWADRTYKHCFNNGALTDAQLQARWDTINARLELPIIAESARWGDVLNGAGVPANPFTLQHWFFARDTLRSNMVDAVSRWIDVCRARGYYPQNDPPLFNQHGGAVPVGFNLTLSAGPGTIVFTMDRTDPRLPGGTVSPLAQTYGGPLTLIANTTLKARLLTDGVWSALAEADFYPPQDFSKLAVNEIMYNPPDAGDIEGSQFEFIELMNTGIEVLDLTGLRFSEGIQYAFPAGSVLGPGQLLVLARNTNQFAVKYPGVPCFGAYTGKLANEGERVSITTALGTRLLSIQYGDQAPWPLAADGLGFSLVPLDPGNHPSSDIGSRWRASANPAGSPGAQDPEPSIARIVINEILAASSPPEVDRIELFNPTDSHAEVGGWFLTDDASAPRKFRVPDATMLEPGGFVIFSETDFNPVPGASNSFAFSSDGERAYLFSADVAGNFTGWSHGLNFGPASPGVSFGRYVISTGEEHFPAQITATFGGPNAGPRVGPVVLNEIHYHPEPGGDEFIEFKNLSAVSVPLYDLARPTHTWRLSGLDYSFPADVTLAPDSLLLLVATDPVGFRVKYGVPAGVPILGPYAGRLQDSGELLELLIPGTPATNGALPESVGEAVRYNDKTPWPVEPDGLGPSLERIEPTTYGNDPINWRASSVSHGTPGWDSPQLRLEATADQLFRLSWNGTGATLEQAPAVSGPWTPSANQETPQFITAGGPGAFFRLR